MLPAIPLASAFLALLGYNIYSLRKGGWIPNRLTLSESIRQLKHEMTAPGQVPHDAQAIWYAGLVVEPAQFTQQLVNLQQSLQRANAPEVRAAGAEANQKVRAKAHAM